MLVLQLLFIGLALLGGTAYDLHQLLDLATTLAFLTSFILSAAILWRAYDATTISHLRRQIRLLFWACATVACGWLILVLGAIVAPDLIRLVPPVALTAVSIVVPLAYLVGSFSVDLLRADLLARQVVTHACTLLAITALLAVVTQVDGLALTPALLAVVAIALYGPTHGVIRRAPILGRDQEQPYEPLNQTTTRLGSTLAAGKLAAIISQGIRKTFREPALALYIKRKQRGKVLERIAAHGLRLPQFVSLHLVEQAFHRADVLVPSGIIQERVEQLPLRGNDEQLVFASAVSLWGVLRNTKGTPIGLLLLGPRGDGDPYRERDLAELGRLLSAAALAFTNSASYEEQVRAERLIWQLYQRLRKIQDQTATRIARELHHEVLNGGVRHNILALELLQRRAAASAPELLDELEELLKNEEMVGGLLRMVCEDLVPVDTTVPLGLASALEKTAELAAAGWEGQQRFVEAGPAVAVPSQVQRELVSITSEAVTNAVKHANATEILVEMQFPLQPDQPLLLSIRDNGPLQRQVEPQAGHLGLHFMQASADAIGATIEWPVQETGGTEVRVVAPRDGLPKQEEDATLDEWWSGKQLADDEGGVDNADDRVAQPASAR